MEPLLQIELLLILHGLVQTLSQHVLRILHLVLLLDLFVFVEFDEARGHFLIDLPILKQHLLRRFERTW